MYCPNCGKNNPESACNCSTCGTSLNTGSNPVPTPIPSDSVNKPKSKTTAGLLGIFLGFLGVHNFYLGFKTKGIIQLVISLLGAILFGAGPIAIEIWALVEAVMYLTGRKNTDAKGNLLV